MLGQIGVPTLILIIIIALLLFGPNKLPELGRAFGRTLKEFKKGAREVMNDEEDLGQERKQTTQIEQGDQVERKEDPRRLPD